MVLKRKKEIQIKQIPKKEIILTRNLLKIMPPGKLLKIDDVFYNNKIKPELDKLGQNTTEMKKIEVIFDLIKVGGKLGIKYNLSEEIPKTPDEVLKDRKGDCDELSLTFLAVAEKAGISIKNFNLLVITFEMKPTLENKKKPKEEDKKEARHAAVLKLTLKSDESDVFKSNSESNKIYLLDLTMPDMEIVELESMDSLEGVYSDKKVIEGEIIGVVSYIIKNDKYEILSTYYEEGGDYYRNQNKALFAMKYYEKALKLNFNNNPLKEKAAINYVYVAVNKIKDKKKQEELLRRAIKLYPEYAEANFQLGTLLAEQKRYKEAIVFLEKAVELKPSNLLFRYNLACRFNSLGLSGKTKEKHMKEAEEEYLKVIKMSEEMLKTNPKNLSALEPFCGANLNLAVIYYAKGDTKKAREYNSNALHYAKQGLKFSKGISRKYNFFLEVKKKAELNFKLFL